MTSQASEATSSATVRPEKSWRERLLQRVQSAAGVWILVAIAAGLTLPSLALGFSTDDRIAARITRDGLGLSAFLRVTPEEVSNLRRTGELSWWTNPDVSIAFLRPIAALSHQLEFQAYPNAAWLMHLSNVLLYVGLVVVALRLYRELLPSQPRLAAVAALLFAIDDGHAATVGWISGRNTLLASFFSLTALWFHVRARRKRGGWVAMLASAACVGLALFSAEAGVVTFAYLLAYAIVFEREGLRARAFPLLPAASVGVVWAALYVAGGYGTRGAGLYRDLSSPFTTFGEGILDLPKWLLSLFGPSVASMTLLVEQAPARSFFLVLLLPLLAAGWHALPRTRENAFFGLGALLCLPPLFTTQPQDRLLIVASFGAFGLLASFIAQAKASASRFVRGTRLVAVALHVWIAPLMFLASLDHTAPIEYGARTIAAAVPSSPPAQVVLVNLPMELLPLYAWQMMRDEGRALPASMPLLYGGASSLVVKRIDARTLEVVAAKGWGRIPADRVFASLESLPQAGTEREGAPMEVKVLESDDEGRPRRVEFRFPTALDSNDRLWLTWRDKRLERWQLPPVGGEAEVVGLNAIAELTPF